MRRRDRANEANELDYTLIAIAAVLLITLMLARACNT